MKHWLKFLVPLLIPLAAWGQSTDRLTGLSASVAVKAPVRAASTGALTLEGEQTVDSVALVDGDRVLVKDQADSAENGIYVVDTADWSRAEDFDGNRDVVDGTLVVVNVDTDVFYRVNADDPITIGTTDIEFDLLTGAVTQASVGEALYPRTAAEIAASVVPDNFAYAPGNTARYGGVCDNAADDTAAVQAAMDVAEESEGVVTIQGGTCVVDPITFDASNITIRGDSRGSVLKASTNIGAGCGILVSLAGGASDATTNQALLDAACPGLGVRTNAPQSLENVVIENLTFEGNANAIRGIWATRLTRGSVIRNNYFSNIDGCSICVNGAWSFAIMNNHVEADGTNGTGIGLGQTNFGTGSGATAVNAVTVIGNELNAGANGMIYNAGAGGFIAGNIFEFNVTDGFASQSAVGLTIVGNYFEGNTGDNLDLGGTNGTDFVVGALVAGNHITQPVGGGHNIRLDGVQNSRIGPNNIGGYLDDGTSKRTQHYFIPSGGGGANVLGNDILVPDITATYISNPTEANAATNYIHPDNGVRPVNAQNGNYTFTAQDAGLRTQKNSGAGGETWTIESNATLPLPVGTRFIGCNMGGGTLTIAITTDTLNSYDETPGTEAMQTGSATIPDQSCFEAVKTDTTEWVLTGNGVT